jgi:hypothetical protein
LPRCNCCPADQAIADYLKYCLDCGIFHKAQEAGLSGDDALTAAFEENARDLARISGS